MPALLQNSNETIQWPPRPDAEADQNQLQPLLFKVLTIVFAVASFIVACISFAHQWNKDRLENDAQAAPEEVPATDEASRPPSPNTSATPSAFPTSTVEESPSRSGDGSGIGLHVLSGGPSGVAISHWRHISEASES